MPSLHVSYLKAPLAASGGAVQVGQHIDTSDDSGDAREDMTIDAWSAYPKEAPDGAAIAEVSAEGADFFVRILDQSAANPTGLAGRLVKDGDTVAFGITATQRVFGYPHNAA